MRIKALQTLLLLGPSMLLTLLLLVLPLAVVALMSLTDWQFGASTLNWVGLENYVSLWHDDTFHKAFFNTLAYMALVSLGSVAIGLGAALLIESHHSLRGLYRTAFFLPVASTFIAMAVVWQFLMNPNIGLINQVFTWFGAAKHNWLKDYDLALISLAVIGIWQMSGLAMVMFLAGLKSIPVELRHAGLLDGMAHPVDRLFRLTLPMLRPTTLFVVTICGIRSLQVFDTVQVLTQGGPNKATEVMLHLIYTEGFGFLKMGYASSMTMVFVVCIFILTLLQQAAMAKRSRC
ncbi:sugar ABC transporter permease [Acerihabitans sp. TG2]|uniref:carbohydrate ABC transporter permease n=1 Tax=Acerihabitans sp. TG2 TaxID=3096008 RepID=UPI002B23CDDF|nr:sugar ABC transporter permease [Acerihabitans sp. TG2]MEA9390381.1 sugar ABC transporter permease [Acerihabitans sp. TG2]